ncbi:TonB-dependent receptor [Reichenbachiella agarivorans]|uniref:TonB-dependent receptor n=1 Tax=Reichenbachiella agarivorans TaxID=2979464 RepID=A0ABY6CLX8_9BACT|nr:TonB-dependent receptor [Reichenbachiella agarivorans]UXP31399.1 TonB-dependent receptor [Reichenbachiella agarivorans]
MSPKQIIISLTLILLMSRGSAFAQNMTQNIRGIITDQDSKSPVIGANVIVIGSDPIKGAVTDVDGSFKITNAEVGRLSLKISIIGYEDKTLPNLLLSSAKELILDITMEESFEKLDEVVVTAQKDKSEVLNEMSLVSARSFSVDETKRFAGSFADPARMVSAFAGVTNSPDGNNDIIVRGNSPKGILWRLEGIEIPNPNHFSNDGATGGPINALSSNMLSNSDFMSGAFAPEYGNALSGVFDMRLRRGNNEEREYTLGLSTLGIDFALEGPFKTDYDGSYLLNYRYSSLDLIDKTGIVDFGGVPKYQDLSFNIQLPVNNKHSFSLFGLGGISSIAVEDIWEDDDEILGKGEFNNKMGTIGLTYNYLINSRSYLKSYIALSGTTLYSTYNKAEDNDSGNFYNAYNEDFTKTYIRTSMTYGYKINTRQKVEIGVINNQIGYNMVQNAWNVEKDQIQNVLEDDGHTYRTQGFVTWKYRATEDLTMTSGLHIQYFGLNKTYNIEPRLAAKWEFAPRRSFNIGAGLHSKMESASVYLWKIYADDGSYSQPNLNLEMSKAAHFVVGYDQAIGSYTHVKAELYYQHLYDVPVENDPNSTFSMINVTDAYSREALVNKGTGRNYGIELTLEQYLHQGFYYLGSASIFNSLYTPMDDVERKTTYASDYIFNLLMGKEFKVGNEGKERILFVNGKVSLLGGKRYTAIDLPASIAAGEEVREDDKPFGSRSDDLFIANIAIGTRRNKNNTTRELKFDVQNVTNNMAVVDEYYVDGKQDIYKATQLPMFPTISYSISF